jgi:transcriptional regulator with XRE-family HTH domain
MIKEKLQDTRLKRGLSQEELADLIGMTQPSYSRKENGIKNITDAEWNKIAKVLKVEVQEIKEDSQPNIVYKNIRGNSFNFGTINNSNEIELVLELVESLKLEKNSLIVENKSLKNEIEKLKIEIEILKSE